MDITTETSGAATIVVLDAESLDASNMGQFKRLVGQDADLRALLAQPAAAEPSQSIVDIQPVAVDSPQFTIGKRQMALR